MTAHIDMSSAADLELLEDFLQSDQAPPEAMGLSELDGFLTGIAVGPDLLVPSEWLPVIWGGEDPAYDDIEEAQAIIGTILVRYNEVLTGLAAAPEDFDPVLAEGPDGEITAADWTAGFVHAMGLRPDSWKPLIEDQDGLPWISPILLLAAPKDMLPPELTDGPDADALFLEAQDHIPDCVVAIDAYWRARGRDPISAGRPVRRSDKVGRNDPCPCGSGRKYKKCCGAT